jgi:hypothetical protein
MQLTLRYPAGQEVINMPDQIPSDQLTAHESVVDEAHVGRFSRGLEALPATPATLHRGRFSEGLERLPESPRKRRPGRFSDGLAQQVDAIPGHQRGSFADARRRRPRVGPAH